MTDAPPPTGRLNPLAVGALVSAFAFAPLGVLLGVIARVQNSRTGDSGDGLALAAIVLGAGITVAFLLLGG